MAAALHRHGCQQRPLLFLIPVTSMRNLSMNTMIPTVHTTVLLSLAQLDLLTTDTPKLRRRISQAMNAGKECRRSSKFRTFAATELDHTRYFTMFTDSSVHRFQEPCLYHTMPPNTNAAWNESFSVFVICVNSYSSGAVFLCSQNLHPCATFITVVTYAS